MSASMTFQPRREMMDIGQDTNGDGIPDGAEVTVRRTATDPVAGHTTVTSARYTKKPAAQERFPMESVPAAPASDLPPAQAPLAPNQQMPNESATPATGNQWDQFKRRTDRAYDSMIGGTRTNTDVNPVAMEDKRRFLERQADNNSIAPNLRANAKQRLAMMDTMAGRSADLANAERQTLITAHGQREKARVDLQKTAMTTDAQRDVAGIRGQTAQAVQEAKTKRDTVVQELKNSGQITVANTYAMAGRDKAELAAETDRAVAQLNKEGHVESAQLLAAAKGKIDPTVWMTASEDERKQLLDMAKVNKTSATSTTSTTTSTPLQSREAKALEALKWARANPKDPRSAGILKSLGQQ